MTSVRVVRVKSSNTSNSNSIVNYIIYCVGVFSVISGAFYLFTEKYDKNYSKAIPLEQVSAFRCAERSDATLQEVSIREAFKPFSKEQRFVKECNYFNGDAISSVTEVIIASEIAELNCGNVAGNMALQLMKEERVLHDDSITNKCYWNKKDGLATTTSTKDTSQKSTVEQFEELNMQPLPVPQPPSPEFLDE
jgi:hypothetical protein